MGEGRGEGEVEPDKKRRGERGRRRERRWKRKEKGRPNDRDSKKEVVSQEERNGGILVFSNISAVSLAFFSQKNSAWHFSCKTTRLTTAISPFVLQLFFS